MKTPAILSIILALTSLSLAGCASRAESSDAAEAESHSESEHHAHRIVVTSPVKKDVVTTQQYVCQIHSCQHIEVRALERGYLEEIRVKEGQAVKKGELMFKILPPLYQARLDSEKAEARRLQIVLDNAQRLLEKGFVSEQEIAIKKAELAKAKAKVKLAETELSFTNVVAPFDGIIDRQYEQLGSLVEEGDMLTSMSDNSLMWVYFNVPEARYLGFMTGGGLRDPQNPQKLTIPGAQIQLKLANGAIFNQTAGDTVTVEGNFNNMTGNVPFRADFPNPDRVLRHGQTGTILIHETLQDSIVIPQRATYEILDKKFVFVVEESDAKEGTEHDKQHVAEHGDESAGEHQSEPAGEDAGEHAAAPDSEPVADHDAEHSSEHSEELAKGMGVVRQREITILHEMEDIFLVKGVGVNDKIIFEGIRQVRDGDKVEYDFKPPEEVLANLKYHAE